MKVIEINHYVLNDKTERFSIVVGNDQFRHYLYTSKKQFVELKNKLEAARKLSGAKRTQTKSRTINKYEVL